MIGIFDSGSGGLTVVRALQKTLPSADILYFADIKRAPYGEKTSSEISTYTADAITLLTHHGASRIISACNSASASLAVSVLEALNNKRPELIEMIGPTAAYFKDTASRILICATPATVRSAIYPQAFRMLGIDVTMCDMGNLAGLIESGASDDVLRASIETSFQHIDSNAFDVVVLACTHYPLIESLFASVIQNKNIILFDPAEEIAEKAKDLWWPQESSEGAAHYILSANSPFFRTTLANIYKDNTSYTVEVIENY